MCANCSAEHATIELTNTNGSNDEEITAVINNFMLEQTNKTPDKFTITQIEHINKDDVTVHLDVPKCGCGCGGGGCRIPQVK